MPAHVGLATYAMIGDQPWGTGKFANVVVDGVAAVPCFDAKPQPAPNWIITKGPKDTTGIQSVVTNQGATDRGFRGLA
jgi:hypothetical protein